MKGNHDCCEAFFFLDSIMCCVYSQKGLSKSSLVLQLKTAESKKPVMNMIQKIMQPVSKEEKEYLNICQWLQLL